MTVFVADHPLIKHKLGLMRQKDISTKDFRDLSAEVARLLTYEATKDLETEKKVIEGWLNSSGHCKNIMNGSVTEMGIATSGDYWTQVFASH